MNSREKYLHWLDAAQYDIESAGVMLAGGRYMYVAFMSQQAIEKLAKGLYTLYTDKEPPRSHNVWIILRRMQKDAVSKDHFKRGSLEGDVERYKGLLAELLSYYISGRYPSYKERISESINAREATRILATTKEMFQWLESLSRYR